ncbi:MAG TPA: alkaline phosphatase family protein [Stellaceae bacterium]|nr:alkaline phosphatase family protein [Stellaceae bacterium]
MIEIGRRNFLRSAAALAAGGIVPARAAPATKLSDIDHIIILMKENRSFDHYFGSLRGVRGFDDPTARRADGGSMFRQADTGHPDGYVLPFRLDTQRTNAQRLHDLSHEWGPQHAAWNAGAMDNWVPAHRAADGPSGPLTMGYLTREDLPFYYALADAFTICDGYHCSVLGPTRPNRYYLMGATIDPDGASGGPAITNAIRPYRWETYPERLERAGISWRVYHELDDYGCNVCRFFAQYHDLPQTSPLFEGALRNRPLYELLWDLRRGNIPQVTWIVPPSTVTEHPDYLPAAGEDHTSQILQALWANPALWAKTALILNYDENDGQFDHVAPPTPEPGTPGEFVDGQPIGLGYRVPCIVISPFSRGGYVCGATFDHTSILRLIEARFGVEIANLTKWRRDTCGDLTAAFGFGATPRLDVPRLPETGRALQVAERRAMSLPAPAVPAHQAMPRQEAGSRPRRA